VSVCVPLLSSLGNGWVKHISPFVARQRLGKRVLALTNACKKRRIDGLGCLWVSLCISLSLLGNNSVKMFLRQQRMIRCIVFYAARVISKESRLLVLPRTSHLIFASPFKPLFIQSIQLRRKRTECDSLAVVYHVIKEGTAQRFSLHERWLSLLICCVKAS
jgi:hypothetical protein